MDWAGSLQQEWWVDVLDQTGNRLGTLDGVTGMSVDYKDGADVRGTGSVDVTLTGPLEWLDRQARIWVRTIDEHGEEDVSPLLTGFMEVPDGNLDEFGESTTISLLDPSVRFGQGIGIASHEVAGTVITTRIRSLLAELGFADPVITESSATLSTPMYWDAGKTYRDVLAGLIEAAGYRGIWCDEWGRPHVEPYILPAARPVAVTLEAGPQATFSPKMTRSTNAPDIINHLIVLSQSSGSTAGLLSERWDQDPASRWSTVSRGRTITKTVTGVEAASQSALDRNADRLWQEARALSGGLSMDMRWQPVRLQQRVAVRSQDVPSGQVDSTYTLQGWSVKAAAGDPLGLAKLTLKEVSS